MTIVLPEQLNALPLLQPEPFCRLFSLAEILSATNNFDESLVVGHGGFGKVYHGVIDDGENTVAIKRLNSTSKQGDSEFRAEIELLSKFRHTHIVSLIGYCNNSSEMILVYDYMVNGSLADHLYKVGKMGNGSTLSWVQRLKICLGAARGLDYLHTGTIVQGSVIHRDVKSSNILLDKNWTSKVSDFGLSRISPSNQSDTHISTNVKGTVGYMDPEYLLTFRLTMKSDVYSFGIVLFEVLCGRRAVDLRLDEEQWSLARWVSQCIKEGTLHQIIDPKLKWEILPNSLTEFVRIADQCLCYRSKKRPTMTQVVASLEFALALQLGTGNSSSFEMDIFSTGEAYDNLQHVDSEIGQQEVIKFGNSDEQNEEIFFSAQEESVLDDDGIKQFRRNPYCSTREVKKPGQMISKGHKHYDLIFNLQIGLRYSIARHASMILREVRQSDFDPKEKFWIKFPSEGSKITPPHQSSEFRWKDYCPVVFRNLREIFQVDPTDYMLAVCGNTALMELSSPRKSGSLFYTTQDDRFMIRTVKKSQVKVLIKMLPRYYQHVCRYENSLVTKFFGVHCVKPVGGLKTRFIVMGNLFCSDYPIHRRFELKGSSYGRSADKPVEEIDETTTLKDLDLNYVFRLEMSWVRGLIKQIERDCEFLEAEKIMDYSLLVGLHFRDDDNTGNKMGLSPFLLCNGEKDSNQNDHKFMRGLEAELQDMDRILAGRNPRIRLGANMPARAEPISRSAETYEVVLYFGISNILQDYDITKKLEHAYKSLQVDPVSISAVDPKLYSKRFQDFLGRVFVEDR